MSEGSRNGPLNLGPNVVTNVPTAFGIAKPEYDLVMEVESITGGKGIVNPEAEHRAAELLMTCILGSIKQQPPGVRDAIMRLMDGTKFVIVFEKRKAT